MLYVGGLHWSNRFDWRNVLEKCWYGTGLVSVWWDDDKWTDVGVMSWSRWCHLLITATAHLTLLETHQTKLMMMVKCWVCAHCVSLQNLRLQRGIWLSCHKIPNFVQLDVLWGSLTDWCVWFPQQVMSEYDCEGTRSRCLQNHDIKTQSQSVCLHIKAKCRVHWQW